MAFIPTLPVTSSSSFSSPLRHSHTRHASYSLQKRHSRRPSTTITTTTMVAAKPDTKSSTETNKSTCSSLSIKALQLISYIRGHKSVFHPGEGFTSTTSVLFRKNDTAREFIPDDQIDTNQSQLPGSKVVLYMGKHYDELISHAIDTVMKKYSSNRFEKSDVIDVLNYNFHATFRAISYGAACQSTSFLHQDNIKIMKMLNEEIAIPSKVLAKAYDVVRDVVVANIAQNDDDDNNNNNIENVKTSTIDCFNIVRDALCK